MSEVVKEQNDGVAVQNCRLTNSDADKHIQDDGKYTWLSMTHLQLLQGFGSHVGIPEVDEGTEALMKDSDALDLTKPVTMETEHLVYRKAVCYR